MGFFIITFYLKLDFYKMNVINFKTTRESQRRFY